MVGLFALLDTLTLLAEGTHGPRRANFYLNHYSLKQIYDKAICQKCAAEQKSLVFIDIDSLTVNETALQELGLLDSQVQGLQFYN